MKAKKEQPPAVKKSSPFTVFLPSLLLVVMLAVIVFKPQGFSSRETYSVDEILYDFMANQMTVNIADYSAHKYYDLNLSQGRELPSYFKKPLFKHPPMYTLLLTLPKRFGLRTVNEANYFSFYLSCLLIPLVFFMARQLYDNRVAFLSFLFLAIEPVYWMCSLRLWMECHLIIFMYLALFMFVLGWKNGNYYILSGVFIGCAMLTKYPGGLVVPVILVYAAVCKPELFRDPKFYAMFVTAFLVFSPWILWNIRVYGDILTNLQFHADIPVRKRMLHSLMGWRSLILLVSGAILWFASYKGYIHKAAVKLGSVKVMVIAAASLFLIFLLSLKGVRGALIESLLLTRFPPVSADFPSIFGKEPWFFYIGQLLKMSPVFILAYAAVFFMGSGSDQDRLLLITAFFVLAFYIKWGNYQSRYIAAAIPALMILAARMFIWLWDESQKLANAAWKKSAGWAVLCVLSYFALKTILVDMHLVEAFLGKDFFIYF